MEIHHFYHLAASFAWPKPLSEHIDAVRKAELPGGITVSITGSAEDRAGARDWLAARWAEADVVEHDGTTGFEAPTLALARDWGARHADDAILYCHAKGSYQPSVFADAWRESMTIDVVGRWRDCIATLETGRIDAAGPHWLNPDVIPNMRIASALNGGSRTPYFGGNFWWATGAYLARLPAPSGLNRWDAERWIGLRYPRAFNLRPGWPSFMIFSGPTAEKMLR